MELKLLLILYTTCVSMHLHFLDSANIPRERSYEMGGEDLKSLLTFLHSSER